MDLRSPLGKVRGLGAAKSGTHHWWMQRVTAVALIPLVIWFAVLVIKSTKGTTGLLDNLASPFNATAMILFLGAMLYHGCLGLRVIIEDYVSCNCGRTFLVIFTNFVTIATAVAVVLSVAFMHFGQAKKSMRDGWRNSSAEKSFFESDKHKRWKQEFYNIMKEERKNGK